MGIYEVILACASITLFGTGLRFCLTCLLPIRGQIEEQQMAIIKRSAKELTSSKVKLIPFDAKISNTNPKIRHI